MSNLEYQNSKLWLNNFGELSTNITTAKADLLRLSQAIVGARENASQLLSLVPKDMVSLTIHSVAHSDALWHLADLLMDEHFNLTPLEVALFGVAAYLHDGGLTTASYTGGISEIVQSPNWSETLRYEFAKHGFCLLYTSPSPRDATLSRMPSSA